MSGLVPPLSSRTSGGICPYPLLLPFAERCQRCDLLVEVEGLHLIAVTRREYSVVLDTWSCRQVVGLAWSGFVDRVF